MKLAKSILCVAITSALSPISFAESATELNNIEKVTVYGDFEQRSIFNTASSVSLITDEDIKLRNAQHLEEMIAISPNLNFSSGTQRARYFQIRGIGERSQFQAPINPSVGIIIDDIDFTGVGSISSMFDIKQAEVFRGPQGTRFGANALAGLVYMTTQDPTDEFEGKLKLTAGNYDSYGAGLAISGPATDKVNYRLAVEKYQSDGFIKNTHLNVEDTNNRDELTVRAKFDISMNPFWQLKFSIFHFDFDNGYDTFSLDNTRETLSDNPGFDTQETTALAVNSFYTKAPHFDITTIVTYADSDMGYGYDEDWTYPEMPTPAEFAGWGYSSTDHYFRDKETATAEVRFSSKANAQADLTWIGGLYVKQDDSSLERQYTYLSSNFNSTFDTDTFAAFAQSEYQLNDKTSLTTGLRVERRSADYKNSDGFTDSQSETMVGGKVVLAYQVTKDATWYGSVNRGYKAGGVNTDGSLPNNLRNFDAEYLWNYEFGYKVSLLDGDAYLRAAAFYMDRKDVQVNSSQTVERSDGSSEFIAYLGNAAEGTNTGIELESGWQMTSDIYVQASLGLLDSEFDGFVNAKGQSLDGRDQAHAPEYTYSVSVNYDLNDNWFINLSAEGKDKFYFSDSHDQQSDRINLLNASINYRYDNWQVNAWIRNITDKDYKVRGFFFGNDPRDGYTDKAYYQYGEPQVFGVTLDYQF